MKITRLLGTALAGLVLVPLAPGVAAHAAPEASGTGGLEWRLCSEVANRWSPDDAETECAMVTVPVDYANPRGRTMDIAINRLKASGTRRGVVLLNPGGPGGSGMGLPRSIRQSHAAGIGVHHDLIGFAPRGVSYSSAMMCDYDWTQPEPGLTEKEKARFEAERDGRRLRDCAARDPELARNLTTADVARDMDRIRIALGEEKISYYGISWGSALGAHYRTMFDAHVDKMLLDSVMAPDFDMIEMDHAQATARENTFAEFAAWVARHDDLYHFGATQGAVSRALLGLRERELVRRDVFDGMITSTRRYWPEMGRKLAELSRTTGPSAAPEARQGALGWDETQTGFSSFQQSAVFCNESVGTRDFDEIWAARERRVAELPVSGAYGWYDVVCVGWPFPVQPWRLTAGSSPLQLVGHLYEQVTPVRWAREMQQRIGGALLVVEDDVHGSLSDLPCASAAVEFFDTGKVSNGSCAGAPLPSA
ncbi:alpha/beta hydrolase fold [Lentzea fradiae]|uniref:Alpha/beta hydrolase fold n=1 Tax=Lentzea fradiae TaxID=200378 RepID=A0A1G7KWI7_9PSEU|nr:alpha/beta fold hydrolase [Lentzea fradiae]SDF41622.1 alpha/beta hydrolase fold [Lentzea fradiae]